MKRSKPRIPTEKELSSLNELFMGRKYLKSYKVSQAERDEELDYFKTASIAVFDDYITDGPGYAGKVYVIVWTGDPCFHDIVIVNKNGKYEIIVKQ